MTTTAILRGVSLSRTVASALPCVVRDGRWQWRLHDKSWGGRARDVLSQLERLERGDVTDSQPFKRNDRKIVFRLQGDPSVDRGHADAAPQTALIVKAFLLTTLRKRLKHHRFGLNEASNMLTAAQRGLPTPRLFGYGQRRTRLGLPDRQVLLIESLDAHTALLDLLQPIREERDAVRDLLARTTPLFTSLYHAGCLHIDVNAANVMLAAAVDANRPAALIDFQHARFRDRPSVEWLLFEAGHFARSCGPIGDKEDSDGDGNGDGNGDVLTAWLDDLLAAIDPTGAVDRDAWRQRFRHYVEADLSRSERRSIRP